MTVVIILFILLTAAFLIPSQLFKQENKIQEVEDSLSIRMHQLKQDFQFRTKELARRLKSNELAQEEWQELTSELQLDTTAAIQSTQKASSSSDTKVSPITAAIMLVLSLTIGTGVYQYSGGKELAKQQIEMIERLKNNPATITDIATQAESIKGNAKDSQKVLEELFLAMRSKIDVNPNDVNAWRAFAMFSARVGRNKEAYTALSRAIRLEPDNVDIQVELAQLYASSKDSNEKLKANRILHQVLNQFPEHEGAGLVLGFNSFSLGLYDVAIKSWKAILTKRQPGSSSAKMLEKSIETAQKKLEEKLSGQLSKHQLASHSIDSNASESSRENTRALTKVEGSAETSASSIAVKITISEAINTRLTGNETLFVFAKAVDGPRFPVAVVKLKLSELDSQIILSDANAMQAQFSLSKYPKVEVSARISITGNAIAQVGDINSQIVILEAPYSASEVKITF
jgi:cytochrome c-type biogenesis protein CcmH